MSDYSSVNPKPSEGTGIASGEYRDDDIIDKTPLAIVNNEDLDLTVEANRLNAAYAIGAMGVGANLGLDGFMAQADITRDGKALWEIEKIKIGGTVYDVTVAASGATYSIALSAVA